MKRTVFPCLGHEDSCQDMRSMRVGLGNGAFFHPEAFCTNATLRGCRNNVLIGSSIQLDQDVWGSSTIRHHTI